MKGGVSIAVRHRKEMLLYMVFGMTKEVGHKVDYSQLVQTINTSSLKIINCDKEFKALVKLLSARNDFTT